MVEGLGTADICVSGPEIKGIGSNKQKNLLFPPFEKWGETLYSSLFQFFFFSTFLFSKQNQVTQIIIEMF